MNWSVGDAFDDQPRDLDLGLRRSMRWRRVRRWIVMASIVVAFLEFMGLPHLRLSVPGSHSRGMPPYWSVTGMRHVSVPHEPLIVLLPLERPLLESVSEAAAGAWAKLTATVGE